MTFKAWLIIAIELILSAILVYILFGKIGEENRRADEAESLAKQRQETINDMQVRQRNVAVLDEKYTKELADAKKTLVICVVMSILALNGCASPQPVRECVKPPPPPAWMMQEPPNLLQTLDGIITITETASPQSTK